MLKKVRRKDLRPGMFVVKYGLGSFDTPFVYPNRVLRDWEEIKRYVPENAREIHVDPERYEAVAASTPPAENEGPVVPGLRDDSPENTRPTDLAEEIHIAEKLYVEAVSFARDLMERVRRGANFSYRESLPLVDGFMDSVFRNETASASLTKLRKLDQYAYTHSVNVSILSLVMGRRLGLSGEELRQLSVAGIFHDIGKARIPDRILNKPGKLTEKEYAVAKTHVQESSRLMTGQAGLGEEALRGVAEHHERWNGKGYHLGLSGENISRFGRILGVVDTYDALTSDRPHQKAVAPARALGMLFTWRGTEFSADCVEAFIKGMGVYPVGSFVRLTGGLYGVVCEVNPDAPLRPKVKVVFDHKMRPMRSHVLDLDEFRNVPEDKVVKIDEALNPADYRVDVGLLLFG